MKEITWGATPRRITAAKRALQRQRDKAPLFTIEIAASQPTPEERIVDFDKWRKRGMKDMRSFDRKTSTDSIEAFIKAEVTKQIKEMAIPPVVHGKYVDVRIEGKGIIVGEGEINAE